MNARKILVLAAAALVGSALLASAAAASALKPTDYQQRSHWLYLPKKPLKKVAIFYLYPSEYSRARAGRSSAPSTIPA